MSRSHGDGRNVPPAERERSRPAQRHARSPFRLPGLRVPRISIASSGSVSLVKYTVRTPNEVGAHEDRHRHTKLQRTGIREFADVQSRLGTPDHAAVRGDPTRYTGPNRYQQIRDLAPDTWCRVSHDQRVLLRIELEEARVGAAQAPDLPIDEIPRNRGRRQGGQFPITDARLRGLCQAGHDRCARIGGLDARGIGSPQFGNQPDECLDDHRIVKCRLARSEDLGGLLVGHPQADTDDRTSGRRSSRRLRGFVRRVESPCRRVRRDSRGRPSARGGAAQSARSDQGNSTAVRIRAPILACFFMVSNSALVRALGLLST